jgi:two-component system invasion response regulator UvrY
MSTRKRFAIADDHGYWRQTLIDIIRNHIADAEIIIEASNGRQLIEQLKEMNIESSPSLVILDLNMPVMDGYDTSRWLQLNRPKIKILTLSLLQNERSIIRLLNYGVLGFIHKNTNGEDLITGISSVLQGNMYFSAFKNAKGEDIHLELSSIIKIKEVVNKWESLTKEEQELIRLCCSDMDYREIEKAMSIQPRTLELMLSNLMKQFEVKNRIALFLLIYKSKLL